MDWLKAKLPSTPRAEAMPAPSASSLTSKASPGTPPATPGAVTQQAVNNKEADELATILKDSAALTALATAGLEAGTLEETPTLELLSELSARLLCRNRARAATAKFGSACLGGGGGGAADASVDAAARSLLPSYFRHEASEGGADDEGSTSLWVAKVFLHALPAAPEGTTLCARFSLQETSGATNEPLHDINLKVPHARRSRHTPSRVLSPSSESAERAWHRAHSHHRTQVTQVAPSSLWPPHPVRSAASRRVVRR